MADGPSAYPLAWPPGWPRMQYRHPWPTSPKPTVDKALRELQDELRRFGAKGIVLSSNCSLGNDNPRDPGVAAYCTYDGQQIAIPCDRWDSVAGNLRAITKTIEAMRGIERWGAKHMVRAMFQGFAALPAPVVPDDWRGLLGNPATLVDAEVAYRERIRSAHPDAGGTHAQAAALNAAIARAREELNRG